MIPWAISGVHWAASQVCNAISPTMAAPITARMPTPAKIAMRTV